MRPAKKTTFNKKKMAKPLRFFVLVVILFFFLYFTLFIYAAIVRNHKQNEQKVLGVSSKIIQVNSDFSSSVAQGSPLVFGGVHAPTNGDFGVWQEYSEIGVSLIRSDFFLEFCAPKNTTVENYKKNINDVQNSQNWPQNCLKNIDGIFAQAKQRNMKVVGVLAYMPQWLSRNADSRSLPKDWEVYEDIVAKIYKLNRDKLDYIEVWNEPDHAEFFTITNGDESKEQNYLELFKHTSRVLRKVDAEANDGKRIKIGGPAVSCPCETGYIQKLLDDEEAHAALDFISIHSYEDGDKYLPKIKRMMEEKGLQNMPIYISEWNKSNLARKDADYNTTYLAVPYTAQRLISFLNNNVTLASYFSLRENDIKSNLPERRSYGFYKKSWNGYELFPQASVWKLMSRELKLGQAESTIIQTENSENAPSLGFVNADKESGVIVVNTGDHATADFNAMHVPFLNQETDIEISRITQQGYESSYCSDRFTPTDGTIHFQFDVPKDSVVSVKFSPAHLSVKEVLKILAISTSRDCLDFN